MAKHYFSIEGDPLHQKISLDPSFGLGNLSVSQAEDESVDSLMRRVEAEVSGLCPSGGPSDCRARLSFLSERPGSVDEATIICGNLACQLNQDQTS